jgi:hypothetical protein
VAAAAVVVEAAVPTTSGSGRGKGRGSGGGDSGGGGGGIGYFGGGGSGGGSGSGLGSGSSSGKLVVTTTAMEAVAAGVTSVAMTAMAEATVVDTPPHDVFSQTPICQLTFNSPQPVVIEATEQEMFHARVFSTITVQEAWDHGNIARLFQPLGLDSFGQCRLVGIAVSRMGSHPSKLTMMNTFLQLPIQQIGTMVFLSLLLHSWPLTTRTSPKMSTLVFLHKSTFCSSFTVCTPWRV